MNSETITLKKKRLHIPQGAKGYLYVEIKPHREYTARYFHLKLEGQREVRLPDRMNPKKVLRAWIMPELLEGEEEKSTVVDVRKETLWTKIKAWLAKSLKKLAKT